MEWISILQLINYFQEQGTVDVLMSQMTPAEKSQYLQLRDAAANLQEEVDQTRSQLEELSKAKNDLEKQISISQVSFNKIYYR